MLENILTGGGANANTGFASAGDIEMLQKALTAGYGTDVSTLTGGAALRVQSLDHAMQATIQDNASFKLFNKLAKNKATATVDEWTEMSSVGGFRGGSSNSELGIIANATGAYARRVGQVKYLMTQRQVSFVQTLQETITDSEAVEYMAGAMQLLTDAEYFSFEGDSTVVPTEFDGITAQMIAGINAGQVDGGNILDCRASSLASVNLVNQSAAIISKYGNFGTPTDIFLSQLTQADFDTGLDPAFRVPLNDVPDGGTKLGAPVVGIRTSWGNIANQPDVYVRDGDQQQPFEVEFPTMTVPSLAPATVPTGAVASNTSSLFGTAQAGNYYYYVTGQNATGQSTGMISAQIAVAASQAVTLTIPKSTLGQETGYVIYRSRLNGGNSIAGSVPGQGSDFRQMVRVPYSGGATTTYVDLNQYIPGTTKAYVLNLKKGDTALTFRQLLPMIKFALYPTNQAIVPWAQMLFGYLRISKRRQHVVIKNILPNGALWRPFN